MSTAVHEIESAETDCRGSHEQTWTWIQHELESEPNKAFVLPRLTASTATLLSIPVTSLEKVLCYG